MLLNQLVRIDETGIVADSVNFGLMEDKDTNQTLCKGFVFNYDKDKPEESTVGVLEALRSSYDSRSYANVHLLVQQYGKGKSHFAVAIANYFSQPADSVEVEGILRKVENAAGENSAIAQRLRSYKKYGRHLVICLSGDRTGDIRTHFLQSLLKILETEGITDSIAQHICHKPLKYLKKISEDLTQRECADAYLETIGSSDGDLNKIIQQLQQNNPAVITTAKNLVAYIKDVDAEDIDFTPNIDIEGILKDLITTHCSGEGSRFQGILILFDELNAYLQNWAKDSIGAGGTALQNITNICEAFKSKIALMSLTQIDPTMGVGIPVGALEIHKQLVSRLAPKGSTYQKVASSLELVLDNLVLQKTDSPAWESFRATWNNVLLSETNNAYEKRITIYREKGWTRDKFHDVLTIGCFPLHPITSYLLCKLSFTQDRTALQFIKKNVKNIIQNQPLETQGKLNWIYPITLLDTFLENFSDDSNYSKYKEAYSAVIGSEDPHELVVLKGLFLFHASGDKLTKTDRESHEEVLATLTGLSVLEVKAALAKLKDTRDIIHYKAEAKLYRFWTGAVPGGIEKDIEEKIREQKVEASIDLVVAFCNGKLEPFLGSKTLAAKHFVDVNKLVADDWQFEHKVYTIDGFIRALSSDQTLRCTAERGILAYVLGETQADLQDFRRRVDKLLAGSAIRDRIAVAIPNDETGELAFVLLKIQELKNKEPAERRRLGVAYDELLKRWEEQVSTQAKKLLTSCTYHCAGIEKILPVEQEKPQRVISLLMENLYPFVPPINGVDKLKSTHNTGRTVVGFLSRQLLADNLTASLLVGNTYSFVDPVFVTSWRLLKKTSQRYSVQEPTHERIKTAWDLISNMADLGEQVEKTIDLQKIWKALSDSPYGYSEYNFTMLLVGWLSYHRKEVSLTGNVTIPPAGKKGTVLITSGTKSLKDWAETNILDRPDEFVKKWIVTGKAKLIRRKKVSAPPRPQSSIHYNEAEHYLLAVQAYLEASELDPSEVTEINKPRDQVIAGVTRIQQWFQPVEAAEGLTDTATLEALLDLYPKLLLTPPAIVLRDDIISVQPAPQQRDRQARASQSVGEQIEQIVEEHRARSESLETEEACGAYKGEVQRLLTQIGQVSNLPPHLAETLQSAWQAAERRLQELKEAAKVRDCLSQIQSRYRSLGNASTQQDYSLIRAQIVTLAQATPAVQQEEEYEKNLKDLDQRYADLTQEVDLWSEKSAGLVSPDQIHELMGEIRGRRDRFTEESSTQKIAKLLEYLERELSRGRDKDEAVKAIKAALSSANRKLERIRDLSGQRYQEAFQIYQELLAGSLPAIESNISLDEYQQELAEFKAKGRNAFISEGFAKIYNFDLKQLEKYHQVKNLLQERLDFIAPYSDFSDVKASLEQALLNLNSRYIELQKLQEIEQKRGQDEQILKFIRNKYKLPKTNTVQFLEDGIREIDTYRLRLHDRESAASEIEQILQTLRSKIADHSRKLQDLGDQLSDIGTLRDLEQVQTAYAKLEHVFQNSTEHPAYEAFQQQIQHLKDDLEKLQNLETQCQQSFSIADCRKTLAAISEEQHTLHNVDRFHQRLTELAGSLQSKLQILTQTLDEFEQKLDELETIKEAKRLHGDLLKNSSQYANSDLADRHEAISANFQYLIDLLQISDLESGKSLEACQTQLDKLVSWRDGIEILVPSLQERFDTIYQAAEKAKAQILKRQQTDIERWLKTLETHAAELSNLTDEVEKGKAAQKLLHKLQRDQIQYAERLNSDHQASLKLVESQCETEINKDRVNQVRIMFQQIPRPQRVSLYQELGNYLTDPTEEFNG